MIANVVKDLVAAVRVLATGAPKVSGTIYVAIRLELDGDADDGKYWDTTSPSWVAAASVAAWPTATYGAAGDWVYQLPAAATSGKVSSTKPARLHWRMTDNVTTPASETASSAEFEEMIYSSGAAEAATGAAASVTGAVGSVTGAVGSVTGAVGSVTGNVGGNVTGSVGSVVGAVGSVTGNVTGSVGSLATQAKADVNAEVVDAVTVDAVAELTADPGSTTSLTKMVMALYMKIRNLETSTATANTIANNAGATIMTATKSDDGTTFTKNKWA